MNHFFNLQASQQDASYAFVALAVIFCCFLSMLLIFVPKVSWIIFYTCLCFCLVVDVLFEKMKNLSSCDTKWINDDLVLFGYLTQTMPWTGVMVQRSEIARKDGVKNFKTYFWVPRCINSIFWCLSRQKTPLRWRHGTHSSFRRFSIIILT